jgi:nucleotide-binding universal stress UspA family protein
MYRHILVPSDGSGLSQKAVEYGVALAVSDAEMDAVNLTRHDFHGEWNYTVSPRALALER